MTGGSECGAGDKDGAPMLAVQVPVGWQRTVEGRAVAYISPSGTILTSVEEVRMYLLTDSTCKCGLECPLVVHKIFNFDPWAVVQQQCQQPGKAKEDMTKLCNHRRKVVAMAALCCSMQASQLPLATHRTGSRFCTMESRDPRGGSLGNREEGEYPGSPQLGLHTHAYPLDTSPSSPSSSSSGALGLGCVGLNHQQRGGGSVSSPPPFSCSSSPSRSLDCPSPQQRSRHSSASSTLSEQGVGMNLAAYAPRIKPSSSPKLRLSPANPKSHLEGMLQQYKESGSTLANSNNLLQHHSAQDNHSNFQVPQNLILPPFTSDRKNGLPGTALAANANGNGSFLSLPLGQLLNQRKPHQHALSFPASSLLSAAAKAQLASQNTQTQNQSYCGNAHFSTSSAMGIGKEAQQSKVLISTYTARPPTTTTLLLPHSSNSRTQHPLPVTILDKPSRQKRQRRSPTVLSMLKESQLNSLRATEEPSPLPTSHCHSSSSTSALLHSQPENHLQYPHPFVSECKPAPGLQKQPDHIQDNKRAGIPATSSTLPSTQPLSALLHLISVQREQASTTQTGSSPSPAPSPVPTTRQDHVQPSLLGLPITPLIQYQAQPPVNMITSHQQSQSFVPAREGPAHPPSPQTFPLMGVPGELDGSPANPKLYQNPSPILALSQPHVSVFQDKGSQIVGLLSQLSSCSSSVSLGEKSLGPRMGKSRHKETNGTSHQGQSSSTAGTLLALDPQESPETKLPGSHGPVLVSPPGDPSNPLQLAESFPFMNQDQLLQLLSPNSGLPSLLLPPFLGSLPIALWMGGGQTPPPPQQQPGLLDQTSQLNILPSMLGAQADLPVNLLDLLNPPPPAPVAAPGTNQAGDLVEKLGPQALLMASLLFSQQQAAAMLPLAGLSQPGLDLLLQQQQQNFPLLPDGVSLEKVAGVSVSGPGLLEALQVTLSSPSLGSASMSCSLLMPSFTPYVADSLSTMSGQGKGNSLPPQVLTPLLAPGVLGDLAALGNINSLHSLMGAGPLLLPPLQPPALAMSIIQGQAASLNPLACLLNNLQVNMGPALTIGGEKPIGMHKPISPTPQDHISAFQLAEDPGHNPAHALGPQHQREGTPGGLLDPYSSFMNTIYNSFLQVSGKSPEKVSGQVGGGTHSPLSNSYPGDPPTPPLQKSAPPSLSPRRACSLWNPDLSHLSMEAAQSPARGTPKLSGESSSMPPPSNLGYMEERSEPSIPSAFPEEAKTDCLAIFPYNNGLLSEEEEQAQPKAHGPVKGVGIGIGEDHMMPQVTQEGKGPTVRTGGLRRGRKRKQELLRGSDSSRVVDAGVTEEPRDMMVLEKPERLVKSKRRRVFR
ncbi:hypothetical protein AAFF_G00276930 [Aldrovandia affinis]|uniref:MBD domain-containing protein n=1 Tax=Aldrovandia affinis TaxID=143900 RepID=A0AAD7W230_9TELE|nr:hypothetical protein AAFF_G00276930 [Aldrovandia affinis]